MEWRDVVGYEGIYIVSDSGVVKSLDRVVVKSNGVRQPRSGRVKKQFLNPDGYMMVKLSKGGSSKNWPVHVVVAMAFVDGYVDGYEVNHKDYDRTHNEASNLEWLSHEENIAHTLAGGRHVTQIRDMSGAENPNYSNHILSERYKDKELALQKQSRPGEKNGRARKCTMFLSSGVSYDFGCMSDCAKFLITNKMVRATKPDGVIPYISKAAESSSTYYGLKFIVE